MFWDELMRRWRRDNRGLGPNLLVGAGGHVAVAPAPRRRSRRWVILLIAGTAALIALALSTGEVQAGPQLV
jgi:hypothetical protein